jgi:hypothetical protein
MLVKLLAVNIFDLLVVILLFIMTWYTSSLVCMMFNTANVVVMWGIQYSRRRGSHSQLVQPTEIRFSLCLEIKDRV